MSDDPNASIELQLEPSGKKKGRTASFSLKEIPIKPPGARGIRLTEEKAKKNKVILRQLSLFD